LYFTCASEEVLFEYAQHIMYNNVQYMEREVHIMGTVNVTIRVDEETKREFDAFCENVGMNITTALNMYMKAVLRTRQLPFPVTDIKQSGQTQAKESLKEAFRVAQIQSIINCTDKMSMNEIDDEIAAYRQEKRKNNAKNSY
jgi:DNA-damage-inducible protein J